MACNNCGEEKKNCGCTSEALSINQICNPIECPADECSESFSASCIRYTGDDLICGNVIVVPTDSNVAQAISNIVSFICTNDTIENDLSCGATVVIPGGTLVEDALNLVLQFFCNQLATSGDLQCPESPTLVVPTNTPLSEALELVFEHFCNEVALLTDAIANIDFPVDDIVAGTGITVTANTVGNITTYTITNNSVATLVNTGFGEPIANDVIGPAYSLRSLIGGSGISILTNPNDLTITNDAPDQVVALTEGNGIDITGTYPNFTIAAELKEFTDIYVSGGIGATIVVPHNLNLSGFNCVVAVIAAGGLPPYQAFIHGIDYTYTVDTNQITITDLVGMPAFRVTVIGR